MKTILIAAIVAALLALGGYWSGHRHGSAELKCQAAQADQATQQRDAADDAREIELENRDDAHREAQRMHERALQDAVAAERSRHGLQQRARQIASAPAQCGGAPPAAAEPGSAPASTPAMVLTDVLSWADGRAAEAAAALDRAYAAGITCEREHAGAVSAADLSAQTE
jgi:FtsZ-interacting cell division protein ZipA